jgi:hypothetical protein
MLSAFTAYREISIGQKLQVPEVVGGLVVGGVDEERLWTQGL